MKYYKGGIPFDKKGNMMNYVGYWEKEHIFKENYVFSATMTVVDYERGRSSVNFILKDQEAKQYYITLHELYDLFPVMVEGVLPIMDWTFAKKGQNYSIKPYKG